MSKEFALGIDIGGTFTKFGFVDKQGRCIAESAIPTNANEPAEVLFSNLFPAVDELYSAYSSEYEMVGVGIGAPNANYYKGTVEMPPNLNWGIVNVVDLVKSHYNLPVTITNDANAAAIGELQFGAARGMKNFIVITLGTGLGSGIVVNGELVYGNDGFAGEIGHTIYDPEGRVCGCGRRGCLETYASSTGIRRTVSELLAEFNLSSSLRGISHNDLTSKMIYEAALKKDPIAIMAFDYTAKVLGLKLADAVACFSPEAIILFGGLASSGNMLLEPVKQYMEQFLLGVFRNKVKVMLSGIAGANAAVLGSAALIWKEMEKLKTEGIN